jgi:hypothetical protein
MSFIDAIPGEMYTFLLASSLVYFALFWFGYYIGIGPLQKLKTDLLSEYEDDLKQLSKKKQPWE